MSQLGPEAQPTSKAIEIQSVSIVEALAPQTNSVISQTSRSSSPSTIAWGRCIQKLTDSEKRLFQENQISSLDELLGGAQIAAKTQEERDRAFNFAKNLQPLTDAVSLFASIAGTTVQSNPAPAALVLSGINCFLSIPARFAEYQEKISEKLLEMGRQFQNLKKYQDSIYEDEDVDNALIQVYIDIIEFCKKAAKLLFDKHGRPSKSIKFHFRPTIRWFDHELETMARKFDQDLRHFESTMQATFVRNATHFQKKLKQEIADMKNTNENIMGALKSMGNINSSFSEMQTTLVPKKHGEQDSMEQIQEWIKEFLAWLPNVDFATDQDNKFKDRLEGTGQWLLSEEKFEEWAREPSSGDISLNTLRVQGKPGCGKSYLAALVVDKFKKDAQVKANRIAVGYAYCSKLDASKSDPVRILSSILRQIIKQSAEHGLEALRRIFDNWQDWRDRSIPTVEKLEEAISTLSSKFKRAFIVLDGLDECHGQGDEALATFCTTLRSIANAGPAVIRLIIFSRPGYSKIQNTFPTDPLIQVDSGKNDGDILQFISNVTSGQDLLVRSNPQLLQIVEETLIKKADGMFLWVKLIMKSLTRVRIKKTLISAINELPRTLFEIYDEAFDKILTQAGDKDLCLKILFWVCNAERPLSSDELKTALQIEEGSMSLDDDYLIESEDGITAECADLIVIREGHYHLLHSSLQDYLTKLELSDSVKIQEYRQLQAGAHKLIGTSCITYLLFDEFRDIQLETEMDIDHELKQHQFLAYATSHVGYHIKASGEEVFGNIIGTFVNCESARTLCTTFYHYFRDNIENEFLGPKSATPLHILSMFNLNKTAEKFLEILYLRNDKDRFGYLPLDYALAQGNREMCLWLLQDGLNPESYPIKEGALLPIHMSVFHDWDDVIETMISIGFNPRRLTSDSYRTPLHEAASLGCQNSLLALLKSKVDVDAEDIDKQTALLEAVEANFEAAIEPLLQAHANVNHHGRERLTALHRVAATGNLKTAKLLANLNAGINDTGSGVCTPLHIASENNNSDIIQLLVDNHACVNQKCQGGFTPLFFAVRAGALEATTTLLKLGADPFLLTDEGESALDIAAMYGDLQIVSLLLERYPSLINAVDKSQNTALHTALFNQQTKVALFLLKSGSSVEASNDRNQTALHLAILYNLEEIIKPLISEYQADRSKPELLGSTPLHYAAQFGHSHLIDLLIANNGADPEAINDDLQGVLHFAALTKNFEFVKKLVATSPNINLGILDKRLQTPLHLAANAGCSELVHFLTKEHQMPSTPDCDKNLPLHVAALNGHLDCVQLLLTKDSINTKGFCSGTALCGAAARGHIDIVRHLLQWDADPNITDKYGRGPLAASLEYNHVEVASLLLLHAGSKADPHTCDKWQSTPLHHAAQTGDKNIVKMLFDLQCDGLAEDQFGTTPFMCAVSSDDLEMVDLFLKRGFNGCSIANIKGAYPFQIAASKGNLKMFRKLIDAGKLLDVDIFSSDLENCTVMNYAAEGGEPGFLPILTQAGVSVDGIEGSDSVPLIDAARGGNVRFLYSLLKKKPALDKVNNFGQTAISVAAAKGLFDTFHLLLKAGADVSIRDLFGYNTLDYACFIPKLWNSVNECLRKSYMPLCEVDRMKILSQTVVATADAIMKLNPVLTPEMELERLKKMLILGRACAYMGKEVAYADAVVILTEVRNPIDGAIFEADIRCSLCMTEPTSGSLSVCVHPSCQSTELCEGCYLDWVKGSDTPRSVPPSVKQLEVLEHELKPIRLAVRFLAGMSATVTWAALDMVNLVGEWFEQKLKEYRDWEEQYNDGGQFKARDIPGCDFIQIMAKVKQIQSADSDNQGPGPKQGARNVMPEGGPASLRERNCDVLATEDSNESIMAGLDQKLRLLFMKCRPDTEIPDFTCCGHKRLTIPTVNWADEDGGAGIFDEKGHITNSWLQEFIKRYQSDEVRVSDRKLSSEPLGLHKQISGKLFSQKQDSNLLLIANLGRADVLFTNDNLEDKATNGPLGLEIKPESQQKNFSTEDNIANTDIGHVDAIETCFITPPSKTVENLDQAIKSQSSSSSESMKDLLEIAKTVPVSPSRQEAFNLMKSSEHVQLANPTTCEEPVKSGTSVTRTDNDHLEESEKNVLDPVKAAKKKRVDVIYRGLRKYLADIIVSLLQELVTLENNNNQAMTLRDAAENYERADRNHSIKPSDTISCNVKIKIMQSDAAFDVVQHILLGQSSVDLVPDWDVLRLLKEEGIIVDHEETSEANMEEEPSNEEVSKNEEEQEGQPDTPNIENEHTPNVTTSSQQVQPPADQALTTDADIQT